MQWHVWGRRRRHDPAARPGPDLHPLHRGSRRCACSRPHSRCFPAATLPDTPLTGPVRDELATELFHDLDTLRNIAMVLPRDRCEQGPPLHPGLYEGLYEGPLRGRASHRAPPLTATPCAALRAPSRCAPRTTSSTRWLSATGARGRVPMPWRQRTLRAGRPLRTQCTPWATATSTRCVACSHAAERRRPVLTPALPPRRGCGLTRRRGARWRGPGPHS